MSEVTPPRWLLLAHQLPTRPSNARVKTWRRLQQIGAVPARNSVYVLPNTEQCREDFEWLRSEIVALGGDATVFAADALNRDGEEDIVATFQRTREADYRALKRDADRMRSSARAKRTVSPRGRDAWSRAVRALRERFNEIERIDFLHAAARREAAEALAALERAAGDDVQRPPRLDAARLSAEDFRGRRWVTRPRPGVDRMASAWLIRRFIDPNATFGFVEQPAASEIPFDMYGGDFSHHGTLCTFETLAQRFGLTDEAAVRIGQIVHDLDMKETRYAAPEAPAVDRLVDGLRQMHADDGVLLQHGIELFDALARSFSSTAAATPRAVRPRAAATRKVSRRRRR
jgi:hypothetical protein